MWDRTCTLQRETDCQIQSLEAELGQFQCRESQLIDEHDRASAFVSAEHLKVTELEKLVVQQARQLDSLKAEGQVGCCSFR